LDIVGESIFLKTLNVKTEEIIVGFENYLVGHQPQKIYSLISWNLQDYNIQKSKFFFGVISHNDSKILYSKIMKIKCYLGIFSTFRSDLLN
jgi:hypothetical protein